MMAALEIAASLAEIFAGLVILGAAIKAWPIFTGMEARLGNQQGDRARIARDVERFADAISKEFGVETRERDPGELIRLLLARLPERRGSDLHFELFPHLGEYPGRVSYSLYDPNAPLAKRHLVSLTSDGYAALMRALESLPNTPWGTSEHAYIQVETCRFILWMTNSVSGPVATLRLLPLHTIAAEELGLDRYPWWPKFEDTLLQARAGLVVCAGPFGSGKSTTATSLVEFVARDEQTKVVTVEYPIEFIINGVTQLSAESQGELESVYRAAQGQLPDMLYLACREPGRFIWDAYGREFQRRILACTTAADAASALEMIYREGRGITKSIDVPFLILGQQLVGQLCKKCRRPVELGEADRQRIAAIQRENAAWSGNEAFGDTFFESAGCDECESGFTGRLALIELLEVTPSLVGRGVTNSREIRSHAIEAGMASNQYWALYHASRGRVSFSALKTVSRENGYDVTW